MSSPSDRWREHARDYVSLINDPAADSHRLRRHGFMDPVVELVRACGPRSLLDVGTGNGWLFREVTVDRACALDVVRFDGLSADVEFRLGDVSDLSAFSPEEFDAAVASMTLMWVEDLPNALRQMRRVTRPGGHLVVAIPHPYFYRTGNADARGNFTIDRPVHEPWSISDLKIGGTVGPFFYFARPLSEYLNALVESGWTLEVSREWGIPRDGTWPSLQTQVVRSPNVPIYWIFRARAS